jgi:hypothetical protein
MAIAVSVKVEKHKLDPCKSGTSLHIPSPKCQTKNGYKISINPNKLRTFTESADRRDCAGNQWNNDVGKGQTDYENIPHRLQRFVTVDRSDNQGVASNTKSKKCIL